MHEIPPFFWLKCRRFARPPLLLIACLNWRRITLSCIEASDLGKDWKISVLTPENRCLSEGGVDTEKGGGTLPKGGCLEWFPVSIALRSAVEGVAHNRSVKGPGDSQRLAQ